MLTALYNTFIGPIEFLIEFVFVFLMKPFENVGFSLIGVSLFVSLMTLPLYHIADQLQKKERDQRMALKPGIDRIKAVFKGDEQYMILNTFYKQNNYHPIYALRNSLSLLIQVPFFIAAYQFLSHLSLLKGQSFLFIADLGVNDAFASIGPITINILPILMTLINLGSAIIYTKGFPFRDRIQTLGISLIFLVLLYNSPAGLVFYWTLNNVFSLIKNIFYKLKKPLLLLYIILVFGSVVFVATVFKAKPTMYLIKKLILLGGVAFLVSIPILIKVINLLLNRYFTPLTKNINKQTTLFFISIFLMFLLMGIVVPSNLVSSSPVEFSFIGDTAHPLSYVGYTSSLFFGLIVLWPTTIYFLSNKKLKTILTISSIILSLSIVTNIFIFKGNYGSIDYLMSFDNPSLLDPNITLKYFPVATFMLITLFVFIVLKNRYYKILDTILIVLTLGSIVSGSISLITISKEFDDYKIALQSTNEHTEKQTGQIKPLISLSREENNVVLLFLDRAISGYFPIIVSQFPNLKTELSGFIFYPNTLSYGRSTIAGGPPLMGGYEYTPEEMNKRSNEKLVDKHNESILVLPHLFYENGFSVTVNNVPFVNYKWAEDPTLFSDYPDIDVRWTRRRFNNRYIYEHAEDFSSEEFKLDESVSKTFPVYTLLKSTFPILRPLIYNDGLYYLSSNLRGNLSKEVDSFLNDFGELYYLKELTEIHSNSGSYTFFDNETPHRPVFLQAPEYKPSNFVTNNFSPLQKMGPYSEEDQKHYHANVASILALNEWLEYIKDQGVYDNTRIIIVADHGFELLSPTFFDFDGDRKVYAGYNPLLLVKDFNSKGDLETDYSLMTNADVPFIATEGIIKNLVNPFTKQNMEEFINKDEINVYRIPSHPDKNKGNQFKHDPDFSFSVTKDIFNQENWTPLDK